MIVLDLLYLVRMLQLEERTTERDFFLHVLNSCIVSLYKRGAMVSIIMQCYRSSPATFIHTHTPHGFPVTEDLQPGEYFKTHFWCLTLDLMYCNCVVYRVYGSISIWADSGIAVLMLTGHRRAEGVSIPQWADGINGYLSDQACLRWVQVHCLKAPLYSPTCLSTENLQISLASTNKKAWQSFRVMQCGWGELIPLQYSTIS